MTEPITNLHIPRRTGLPQNGITVLAGDVGGTKTNLAFYSATDSEMKLLFENRYPSHDYKSCIEILDKFLSENKQAKPDRICLGVAGPVINGTVELTNLNWNLDIKEVQSELGVNDVSLINDLESMAYGLAGLTPDDFIVLSKGDSNAKGNMAIVAPGTGLGEAGLYWDGKNHHPLPTEGGHCDFCPRTKLDMELTVYLQKKYGVVSWEKVIAGPGIYDIYVFLCDRRKHEEPSWLTEALQKEKTRPAVISNAAIDKKDPICMETMDHFVRYLARETSNMVLKMKAVGGIFLGGGIPPKIASLLQQKSFMEHYMDCDRMQHLLENVPIRIIKNEKTGLIGAGYYGAYVYK